MYPRLIAGEPLAFQSDHNVNRFVAFDLALTWRGLRALD